MTGDVGPEIPAQYVLSAQAPEPRTLIDILYDTAGRHPDSPAIDDGEVQLTYAELIADIEDSVEWLATRGIGRGDRIGIRMPSGSTRCTWRSSRRWPAAPPTCRSTPTTPTNGPSWCSPRPGWSRSSPRRGWSARRVPRAGGAPPPHWAVTTHGSSSRRDPPAPPKALRSRTEVPPRSSTRKHECSCRATRSGRATGCSPACRWRSTRRARRCGWPGGMARAWCLRHGRWCAAAWTWVRGWCPATSRSSRRCRRSRRCGLPRRWRRCGC